MLYKPAKNTWLAKFTVKFIEFLWIVGEYLPFPVVVEMVSDFVETVAIDYGLVALNEDVFSEIEDAIQEIKRVVAPKPDTDVKALLLNRLSNQN